MIIALGEAMAAFDSFAKSADQVSPNAQIVQEPSPVAVAAPEQVQLPDLYELYPDLAQIDVTDPSALSDYFGAVAEMMASAQQQQAQVVQAGQPVAIVPNQQFV